MINVIILLVSPALRSWWGLKHADISHMAAHVAVSPALRSWWGLKPNSFPSMSVCLSVSPALRSWWGLKQHRRMHVRGDKALRGITGSSELVGIETKTHQESQERAVMYHRLFGAGGD